jgi:hypothetical protein
MGGVGSTGGCGTGGSGAVKEPNAGIGSSDVSKQSWSSVPSWFAAIASDMAKRPSGNVMRDHAIMLGASVAKAENRR